MFRKKFIPDAEQDGGGVKKHPRDSLASLLLKLASGHGYNESLNIRGQDGTFLPETNVLALASYATTPERYLPGKSDFVGLMSMLGIDPELIANEPMRMQLSNSRPTPQLPPRSPSMPTLYPQATVTPPAEMPELTLMRPPPPLILMEPRVSIPPLVSRNTPESMVPPRPVVKPRIRRVTRQANETELQPHEMSLPEIVTPNVPTKRGSEQNNVSKRFGYQAYDSDND
jgi:hypothetical protein